MDIIAPASPSLLASNWLSCPHCDIALPLRASRPGEVPFDWQCTNCHTSVTAILVLQPDEALRQRVRLQAFRTHPRTSLTPPSGLQAVSAASPAPARAGSRRLNVAVPALGLDESMHPTTAVVVMLSQEISTSSIALLHVAPWTSPLVAVQLPGHTATPLQLAVRVDGCSPIGDVWLVSGHFTQRLGA